MSHSYSQTAGAGYPPHSAEDNPKWTGELTGRYIATFHKDGVKDGLQAIMNATGARNICHNADFYATGGDATQAQKVDILVLDKLGMAIVNTDPSQGAQLQTAVARHDTLLSLEPESVLRSQDRLLQPTRSFTPSPFAYLDGYRDAVNTLYNTLSRGTPSTNAAHATGDYTTSLANTDESAWGLQATRVASTILPNGTVIPGSRYSGRNVKIAVLDTGFQEDHPDFAGRDVHCFDLAFLPPDRPDIVPRDLHGAGTLYTGTACGPLVPTRDDPLTNRRARRYGCAYESSIYSIKIRHWHLNWIIGAILRGIDLALLEGCRVILLPFSIPFSPGTPCCAGSGIDFAAQRAYDQGGLLIAATGDDSVRSWDDRCQTTGTNPIGRPACCPKVMSVAAVDYNLQVARFSNGQIVAGGAPVTLAGPGVNIFSTLPDPIPPPRPGYPEWPGSPYHMASGTPMAAAHVAGIAALWLEADPLLSTTQALWTRLVETALPLNESAWAVGAGLVQAPP